MGVIEASECVTWPNTVGCEGGVRWWRFALGSPMVPNLSAHVRTHADCARTSGHIPFWWCCELVVEGRPRGFTKTERTRKTLACRGGQKYDSFHAIFSRLFL